MKGFLGTAASFSADLNLIFQIVVGMAVFGGALLARARRYSAHGLCMTVALLLNLVSIGFVMMPSLDELVLPRLPSHLGKRYYDVAAAHGVLGVAAELFGLYILLVARTNLVPEAWRFRRWRIWMRLEFGLWMTALLAGIATYIVWYTRP